MTLGVAADPRMTTGANHLTEDDKPQSATALASWARALRKALDKHGLDSAALFAQAGLDIAALSDPQARYPLAGTTRLWRLAVQATGDPCLGLTVASQVTPTTFHALGYSLVASATLKEAFERINRYFRLVTDAAELEFGPEGDCYRLVVRTPKGQAEPALEATDAFLSLFVRICRSALGREFSPLSLSLRRPEPPGNDGFRRVFRCPITFNAPLNELRFERAALEQPLEGANAELARHNDEIVVRYLAAFDKQNLRARVRAALIEQLPLGEPSAEKVAATLHMSLRSLQRKLVEEGSAYEDLLNSTRRELAQSYLRDPAYSISETAYLLGFSDTSSFTRAFKRWTGQSPSHFRLKAVTPLLAGEGRGC